MIDEIKFPSDSESPKEKKDFKSKRESMLNISLMSVERGYNSDGEMVNIKAE